MAKSEKPAKEPKAPKVKEPKAPKEPKDKKNKGKNQVNNQPAMSTPAATVPLTGTPSTGAPTVPNGVPPTGAQTTGIPSTGAPGQTGATSIPSAGQASVPLSAMQPDQMTPAQLEQAIKDSNDPKNQLKRLRSPLNLRSCLLNVLFLIIMTLVIVIIWCALAVDKFNFGTVFLDMMNQLGIAPAFKSMGDWFVKLFTGQLGK